MIDKGRSANIFHHLSKDLKQDGNVFIPQDIKQWPYSWKTVEYKEYYGSHKVILTDTPFTGEFDDLLMARISKREHNELQMSFDDLSYILTRSIAEKKTHKDLKKRMYPSGGSRYPLESYIYINKCSDFESQNIYHYNVKNNTLETIECKSLDLSRVSSYPWIKECKLIFFISAVFDRTFRKYGERGYRYILLEAGHVGQNICLASAKKGLSAIPLGGVDDLYIESALGVDGKEESIVYTIAIM